MKKIFSLLTLALLTISTAWAADGVSATQTFTDGRATCTWTSMNVTVSKNATAGGDGLYFVAGNSGTISTSDNVVNIKVGRTMYVQVPSASSHGTITIVGSQNKSDRSVSLNSGETIAMSTGGESANFVSTDVENVNEGYYIKLVSSSDFKFNQVSVTLVGETYPESVAVDPEFSISVGTITTTQSSQIIVGSKPDLDEITLSDITYGTPGVVTVDENGVVTPVAEGSTTINFNTSAVAGKYNASTGNSVSIVVIAAVPVFNANGDPNQKAGLTRELISLYDYLTVTTNTWSSSQTIDGFTGEFFNMSSSDRQLSIKVTGASSFVIYVKNNTNGRTYDVKVGENDAVTVTHTGTNVEPSGVFTIADPTAETIILLSGGGESVYPAYIVFNPAETMSIYKEYATYVTENALDFTGVAELTAYVATDAVGDAVSLTAVETVPAGTPLVLHGVEMGEYIVPVIASAVAPAVNRLVAGTGAAINSANLYVLSEQSGNIVFASTEENEAVVPVGKAYLDLTGMNAAPALRIVEGENHATNIEQLDRSEKAVKFIENGNLFFLRDGVVYDATGRVVR
jgi:hypothetical protein